MKAVIIAAAGFLAVGLPAYAQAPTSNATTQGTMTTPGNAAGMPSASTPAGQLTPGGGASVAPPAVPATPTSPVQAAPAPTADSTTTGTTTPK